MTPQSGILLSSDSSYAHRRKELLELVKKLRASGAQADLDLPRIAVIGNQSAGKSSLVEAISGITVPRDAGTCTRCPMECRMSSSSGPWACQISIRWEFDGRGKRRDKVKESFFGGVISDKREVELMLRRAQAAVLHPTVSPDKFLNMSLEDLTGGLKYSEHEALSFSRNAVCIDLMGSELTDLSFVDLPGIIQNAEPEIVQLVQDLVMSHIKGNCLILVTLPMSDDIDNQKAARLARDVDPSGTWTIGVLTKPDTLPSGSVKLRELWLELLEGRTAANQLMHGYFCTRQPDDAERAAGITATQARASEMEFFAKNPPWNKSPHQHRFGTQNLVDTLSKLLTQRINDTLPNLQGEVVTQLAKCNTELDQLPPAVTTEPAAYVLNLVTEFCRDVRDYVQGGTSTETLVQMNRQIYTAFKHGIRSTAPRFIPYPSAKEAGKDAADYLKIDVDGDDDNSSDPNSGPAAVASSSGKLMYLADVKQFIEQSITRELPNNVPYPVKVQLILDFQTSWGQYSRDCFEEVYKAFDETLAFLIQKRFRRYGNLQARVRLAVQELLKAHKEGTLVHLANMLKLETTPFTQNSHYLAEKTAKSLALYKDARAGNGLAKTLLPVAAPKRASTSNGQSSTAKAAPQPFNFSSSVEPVTLTPQTFFGASANGFSSAGTQNSSNAANGTGGFVTFAASSQSSFAGPSPTGSMSNLNSDEHKQNIQDALAALAKVGFYVTADDLGKLNPPDIYEEELQIMAEVRAYFHVAYKRVIDYVPLSIDHLFLYGLTEALQQSLIEKLGLGSSKSTERCEAYIAEDPSIVSTRMELIGKKERLESVQMELHNFGLY